MRRLCGWSRPSEVPSESTFSRAFAEFADGELPARVHEASISRSHADRLVGHIARDSTAIEGHEKPRRAEKHEPTPKPTSRKRGRPRKGEEPARQPPSRLERQADMTLSQMLADPPRHCDVGVKRNAKGYQETWIDHKLHISRRMRSIRPDTADGDIPVSCILTSASVHDSQVAIPLRSA